MKDVYTSDYNDYGELNISDEVITIIASVAASEIKGISGMATGISGITEKFGMKNPSKGIKVVVEDNLINLEMNIIVDFGVNLLEIGEKVQANVKKSVETMTGLKVKEVNVNIQAINFVKDKKVEIESKSK